MVWTLGFYGAVFVGQVLRSDGSSTSVAVKMMKEKKEYIQNREVRFAKWISNLEEGSCIHLQKFDEVNLKS
jgi:hypothetical protein